MKRSKTRKIWVGLTLSLLSLVACDLNRSEEASEVIKIALPPGERPSYSAWVCKGHSKQIAIYVGLSGAPCPTVRPDIYFGSDTPKTQPFTVLYLADDTLHPHEPVSLGSSDGGSAYHYFEPPQRRAGAIYAISGELTLDFEPVNAWEDGQAFDGSYHFTSDLGFYFEETFAGRHCGGPPDCSHD